MADSDYALAKYMHPNTGSHSVVGGITHTNYGYRAGGEIFLVNRSDIEGQPHLFSIIDEKPTVIPPLVTEEVREPVALAPEKPKATRRTPAKKA